MTTENVTNLDAYKQKRVQISNITHFKNYLKLLDNAELITEARGFMGDIKNDGLTEECPHRGQMIINELISRVKEGRFRATLRLEELQRELGNLCQEEL